MSSLLARLFFGKPLSDERPRPPGTPAPLIEGVGDPAQLRLLPRRKRLVLCASRCIIVNRPDHENR
ncbi:MAG: hypothetical protein Q7Q73_04255 [Verrucomicrobiota bacterium JB024]|nr:hypothetical protein [Verrucomicrobiota bacterium JB024]